MAVVAAHPILSALVAMEAGSQVSQGIAARQEAKYNANVANMRAEQAKRAADIERYRLDRRKRLLMGKQRALYAKAGVTLEGTPLEVLADTSGQFALDKAINDYNAKTGISRNLYEANFQRYAGNQKFGAGFLNAGGTILSGYGSMKGLGTAKPKPILGGVTAV